MIACQSVFVSLDYIAYYVVTCLRKRKENDIFHRFLTAAFFCYAITLCLLVCSFILIELAPQALSEQTNTSICSAFITNGKPLETKFNILKIWYVLRLIGDKGVCAQEHGGDANRILQSSEGYFGRINNASSEHIYILAAKGIEAIAKRLV